MDNSNSYSKPRQLNLLTMLDFVQNPKDISFIFDDSVPTNIQIEYIVPTLIEMLDPEDQEKIIEMQMTGRPGLSNYSVFCMMVYQSLTKNEKMKACIKNVRENPNLLSAMQIANNIKIHASSVSRKATQLSLSINIEEAIHKFYQKYKKSEVIHYASIDSTMVYAHEKADPIKEELWIDRYITLYIQSLYGGNIPKRRVRWEIDRDNQVTEKLKMHYALYGSFNKLAEGINTNCSWGQKRNSHSKVENFLGYKLHFLIDDFGAIASYLITGANVHDSVPYILLTRKCRVPYKVALADAAYYTKFIMEYEEARNHRTIIDVNIRNNKDPNAIPEKTPKEKLEYNKRQKVEQTNSTIKSLFISKDFHYRGKRLKTQLEISIFLFNFKRLTEPSLGKALQVA